MSDDEGKSSSFRNTEERRLPEDFIKRREGLAIEYANIYQGYTTKNDELLGDSLLNFIGYTRYLLSRIMPSLSVEDGDLAKQTLEKLISFVDRNKDSKFKSRETMKEIDSVYYDTLNLLNNYKFDDLIYRDAKLW